MSDPKQFHRLFGLSLIDFFEGTDFEVETELDLSLKQQFLDVVVIRKGPRPLLRRLPDGFEDLSAHNLITFKSYQEALDPWALHELIGHFVNYRKQTSSSLESLVPEDQFRLFAVCSRFPRLLASRVRFNSVREGVYEVDALGLVIQVIVANQLPEEEQNALLHLFSAQAELLSYGQAHYQPHSKQVSTVLLQLLHLYKEDQTMNQKLQDFVNETLDKMLSTLTMEQRLKGLSPEELIKHVPLKELLKFSSADEVLNSLPPQTLEDLKRRIKTNGSVPNTDN